MVEKLTKTDEIKLTGKKLKMAEMLANPDFSGTNKELYEAVGISHDTFYKWIRDETILRYTELLVEKYTDGELSAVWKSLIKKCRDGDIQAIKLYFELKGKYGNAADRNKDDESGGYGVVVLPAVESEKNG